MEITKNVAIIIACVGLIVSLGIGFIIGHFTVGKDTSNDEVVNYYRSLIEDVQPDALNDIVKLVDRQRLRKNLE